MGLKKAYDELTDNPEFSDGLHLPNGAESDITGVDGTKMVFYEKGVLIYNEDGNPSFLAQSTGTSVRAYNGTPFKIDNIDSSGTGRSVVEYQATDSLPGTIKLTNAVLRIDDANDKETLAITGYRQNAHNKYYTTRRTISSGTTGVVSDNVLFRGWRVIVTGRDVSTTGGPYFTDVLVGAKDVFERSDSVTNGTGITRNYTFNNGALELSISESIDVNISAKTFNMDVA